LSQPGAALAAKSPGGGGGGTSTAATVVDYSQCANGAKPSISLACPGGWINGALQSSNSHYREDDATAQRVLVSVPAAGTGTKVHTLKFSYLTRKGSANAHAYDSLTTWNLTQTAADRCQGYSSRITCPAGTGPGGTPTTWDIPADPTAVAPGANPTTSAHQRGDAVSPYGRMTMYGGTITGVTEPVHDNAGGTGDDYATIVVSYTVPTSTSAKNVQLLFGGHLAPSTGGRGWGPGLGASSISGGPYHIKWTEIDGASAGSRDNQIQASAIAALPPEFGIDKVADKTTAQPGETVTYTITVTNTGDAGTASFVDTYQEGVVVVASSLPAFCHNDATTRTITCDVPVGSNTSRSFTYQMKMPTQFDDTDNQDLAPCQGGTFRVRNVATLVTGASDSADVCVDADPAFTILKSSSVVPPATVAPNAEVTYTVTVTNVGKAPGSTSFSDPLTNLTLVTAGPGCSGSTTLTCTTGTLAPGAHQDFTYTVKVPAAYSGTPNQSPCQATQTSDSYKVTNTATLANGQSSTAIVCVRAKPNLVPDKSASPTTSTLGGIVKYTITITNQGDAAGGGSFQDVYQQGVTIIKNDATRPFPSACQDDTANHTVTCTVTTLAAGGQATFNYWAKMPTAKPATGTGCDPAEGRVINTVTIQGNSDGATVCIPTANFVPSKTANPTNVNAGAQVTYTITVTNTGTIAGTPTEPAVDVYPAGVTIVTTDADLAAMGCTHTSATRTISCTFGSIAAGGSASKSFIAKMPDFFTSPPTSSQCPPGQYRLVNKVTINSVTAEAPNCVKADPAFSKAKSVSPTGSVNPGTVVTYTVTITNTGKAPGATSFTDHYDEGVVIQTTNAQFAAMGCTHTPATRAISCTTGLIAPNNGTQQFVYTAKMPTSYTEGSLGAPCGSTELPVANAVTFNSGGSPTSVTVCVKMPVLTVNKSACTAQAIPVNGILQYTITYSNTGSAPSTNTVVSDDLPDGTSVANPGGGQVNGGVISWDIGTLAAGGSGSKTFSVSVDQGTSGPLENVAEIHSTETSDSSNTVTNSVGNLGAAASGRAYGATVSLLGATIVPPTPDTTSGTKSLLTLPPNPLANLGLLTVSNDSHVTSTEAEDDATSTVANVSVNLSPLVKVEAAAVVAKSVSTATGSTAHSVTDGSEVLGLSINGQSIGDVSAPRTITIVNLLNIPIAEVLVLEHTQASGAALGGAAGAQPQNGSFSSGIAVNGLRVRLLDGTASVTVAHAESKATHPSATPCAGTGPYVIGSATNVNANVAVLNSPTVEQQVNSVVLNSTGGSVGATINSLAISGLAISGTGTTSSNGTLSPLHAHSTASIEQLAVGLLPGGISADVVTSTADATPTTKTGSTTISNLKIGGLTICVICDPVAPNTVLLDVSKTLKIVLNEQIVSANQITVNAIHIYVLKPGNPLGLLVNSDVIINQSIAGTS